MIAISHGQEASAYQTKQIVETIFGAAQAQTPQASSPFCRIWRSAKFPQKEFLPPQSVAFPVTRPAADGIGLFRFKFTNILGQHCHANASPFGHLSWCLKFLWVSARSTRTPCFAGGDHGDYQSCGLQILQVTLQFFCDINDKLTAALLTSLC